MADEEGEVCDECGKRIGPAGRCVVGGARASREKRLVELLRDAQNRLRNQGDVPWITGRMNYELHDRIERELGGGLFLADSHYPVKKDRKVNT